MTCEPSPITRLVQQVREYTAVHTELQQAHHFLFDLHVHPERRVKFVVLGINPGESQEDWVISPQHTEETSDHDFHEADGRGRDKIRWTRHCEYFLSTTEVLLMELFFWSSRDMGEFRARYGSLHRSPHLPFCTAMNRRLLEHYLPRSVICPGLGSMAVAEQQYGLIAGGVPPVLNAAGHRLVEVRTDGTRPWIFTKHWTGARLSRLEKDLIRKAIGEHGSG